MNSPPLPDQGGGDAEYGSVAVLVAYIVAHRCKLRAFSDYDKGAPY